MAQSPGWDDDPRRNDPRTVTELIAAALADPSYDIDGWEAVAALHWRGSEEACERAVELCHSICTVERRVGADILGQLGIPERTFPNRCLRVLLGMLRAEQDASVLKSVLIALGHLRQDGAIGPAASFRRHPDSAVRDAVIHVLMGHDDPLAIDSLIELSTDEDARVRDWATFSLGTQTELDTPAVRDALVARREDPDDDARAEALVGLTRRGDKRVVAALCRELESDAAGTLVLEAATLAGDPQLRPALLQLEEWCDHFSSLVAEAILACTPRAD